MAVIPPGTKCDANCPAWAHVRITARTGLHVYLCAHHEHELLTEELTEYTTRYNPTTV